MDNILKGISWSFATLLGFILAWLYDRWKRHKSKHEREIRLTQMLLEDLLANTKIAEENLKLLEREQELLPAKKMIIAGLLTYRAGGWFLIAPELPEQFKSKKDLVSNLRSLEIGYEDLNQTISNREALKSFGRALNNFESLIALFDYTLVQKTNQLIEALGEAMPTAYAAQTEMMRSRRDRVKRALMRYRKHYQANES